MCNRPSVAADPQEDRTLAQGREQAASGRGFRNQSRSENTELEFRSDQLKGPLKILALVQAKIIGIHIDETCPGEINQVVTPPRLDSSPVLDGYHHTPFAASLKGPSTDSQQVRLVSDLELHAGSIVKLEAIPKGKGSNAISRFDPAPGIHDYQRGTSSHPDRPIPTEGRPVIHFQGRLRADP